MPKLSDARKRAGATKMGGSGRTKAADLHHFPVVPPRGKTSVTILAVDPGETHVGLAVGHADETSEHGWTVTDVAELEPWEFVQWFRDALPCLDLLTVEKFTLYKSLAMEQVGSEMPTSKLIGWIEFTVRLWNEVMITDPAGRAYRYPAVEYVSYPANIHAGTSSLMKNRGIPFVSPLTPDHARSAELHLWHALVRWALVKGVELA